MNILDVILLSIVEGITEFLPISSTGHLILTSHLLQIQQSEFLKTFEIAIQLGAILAVVTLYAQKVLRNLILIPKLIVAFLPAAILGFFFYDMIKQYLLENTLITAIALLIGGIVLIGLELYFIRTEKPKTNKLSSENRKLITDNRTFNSQLSAISYKQSLAIGFFQSVSMIPGVSRAAATIVGGLFMGLSRRDATEFSFLLAVPTMAAATGLDLLKTSSSFTSQQYQQLALGFILSFIVALVVIKLLLKYIQTHTFIPFGVYRIIIAVLFILFIL